MPEKKTKKNPQDNKRLIKTYRENVFPNVSSAQIDDNVECISCCDNRKLPKQCDFLSLYTQTGLQAGAEQSAQEVGGEEEEETKTITDSQLKCNST